MNIPNKAANASVEAILNDLLTLPVAHRGLVLKMLVRYAETAAPHIVAQGLRDYARTLDDSTLVDAHMIHEAADAWEGEE